jgi:hypothetical protein
LILQDDQGTEDHAVLGGELSVYQIRNLLVLLVEYSYIPIIGLGMLTYIAGERYLIEARV